MGRRLGLILLMAGLMFGAVAGQAWAQASPFERLRAAYAVRDAEAAAAAYEADAEVRYEYEGAPIEVHRGREAIRASFAAFFDQLEPGQPVDLNFRVIEVQGFRTVGVYRLRIGEHESYGRFDATTGPSGLFVEDTSRDATKADFDAAPPALLIPEVGGAQQRPGSIQDAYQSKVGDHVRAYLSAVNDGESAARIFRGHVTETFANDVPEGPFLRYFATQRRVTGGVDLMASRPVGETAVDLLLTDKIYGARQGLHLAFDPEDGGRISVFEPGPEPEWAPKPEIELDPAEIGAKALALIDRGCNAKVFSGAALIAKGDAVLAQAACGSANRRYDAVNTVRTRFNLGSMNKMFTAVAVMQLVEAGRVGLDDPLSRYADESWLARDVSDRIKVRHLLTHTSGLGDFLSDAFEAGSRLSYREVSDFKPLVNGSSPTFEPGSDFRYSNMGMLLLGQVIEAASGQSYFDYVREHVLAPAGMTDTDSWPMDEPQPNLAMGYQWAPDAPFGWRENTFQHVFRGTPAGGGYSTVSDLHRFARALTTDRLISAESRTFLWTDQPPHHYGGGFMIEPSTAGRIVGHEGSFPGISSRLDIYTDKDYVVVVLGNQDAAAGGLGAALRGLVAQSR